MINFYRLTLFTVTLLSALQCVSQSVFYQFSKLTSAYADLASPTVLTTTMAANYEVMPVPTGFKAFNVALPSSFKVGKNGWIVCTGPTRSFAFNPFLEALSATATTTVSYKLEATGQDSILKVEWRNVMPENGTVGELLSFQLWFYKNSQAIEFHYGPSNVTTAVDPALQIALLSADFVSAEYEIHSLSGNATSVKDSLSGDTLIVHSGVPPNGTVYRFTHPSTGIRHTLPQNAICVYPNPANGSLYINSTDALFKIMDVSGRQVGGGSCSSTRHIDTHHLQSGVFVLVLEAGGLVTAQNICIQH